MIKFITKAALIIICLLASLPTACMTLIILWLMACKLFYNDGRQIQEIEYNIPKLNLDFFSDERKDILFDYLSQSSEWHVFPMYKTVLAKKRNTSITCQPTSELYPASYGGHPIPSLGGQFFNLYPDTFTIPESNAATKNKVSENSKIVFKIDKHYLEKPSEGMGIIINSNLEVQSKNQKLSLNSREGSKDIHRSVTTNFLLSTSKELERLAHVTGKANKFTDTSILPLGSTIISDHPIFSINQIRISTYIVSGYVNLGKKGLIYLKVISQKTGDQINMNSYKLESTNVEYVGWSSNPHRKFNFCLETSVAAIKNGPIIFPAEFQIWFKPSDNSPDKILHKQTLSVQGWHK